MERRAVEAKEKLFRFIDNVGGCGEVVSAFLKREWDRMRTKGEVTWAESSWSILITNTETVNQRALERKELLRVDANSQHYMHNIIRLKVRLWYCRTVATYNMLYEFMKCSIVQQLLGLTTFSQSVSYRTAVSRLVIMRPLTTTMRWNRVTMQSQDSIMNL